MFYNILECAKISLIFVGLWASNTVPSSRLWPIKGTKLSYCSSLIWTNWSISWETHHDKNNPSSHLFSPFQFFCTCCTEVVTFFSSQSGSYSHLQFHTYSVCLLFSSCLLPAVPSTKLRKLSLPVIPQCQSLPPLREPPRTHRYFKALVHLHISKSWSDWVKAVAPYV